jgi:hypothetical protein
MGLKVGLLKFYYFSNVKLTKKFISLFLTTNYFIYFVELDDENNIDKGDDTL